MRRRWLVLVVVVAAVCPVATGALADSAAPPAVSLSFSGDGAVTANGALPNIDATQNCGSPTATYLAELLNTNPADAKVKYHWGDIVPGKDMMASGIVQDVSLGTGDLPFDHPFGSDLNLNLQLDAPYLHLGQAVNGSGDGGAGTVHVELSEGLLPHTTVTAGADGQTWKELSNNNRNGITDGYVPQNGDRAVVMGRWIVDCGHNNFGSELHPITFMAFAHTVGDTTSVHFFANPYRDTQLYNPNRGLSGQVNDPSRLGLDDTSPFPQQLVQEVIRVLQGKDHLQASELLEANHQDPTPWQVCAPDTATGQYPAWTSQIMSRTGTQITFTPVDGSRCVSVSTTRTADYVAAAPVLHSCSLPWDWLNAQAAAEAGVPGLNIQSVIDSKIPQQYWPAIARTPDSMCADALAAPTVDNLTNQTAVNDSQPFPFYGVITVAASNTPPPTTTTTPTSTTMPTSTLPTVTTSAAPQAGQSSAAVTDGSNGATTTPSQSAPADAVTSQVTFTG